MTEFDGLPTLREPVAVIAFAGWNDAGEAATTVIEHLATLWDAEPVGSIDPDEYYDFQVNRPNVVIDGDLSAPEPPTSHIEWSTTRVSSCSPPGAESDVVLVHGIEPNMRWRGFCEELLELLFALDVKRVVLLGALLSDTAHTRPTPVTGSATDAALLAPLGLEPSRYEGPTGIVGVLQQACATAELPAISVWAQVPHYVSQPPNPKATLALVHHLEDVLDVRIGLGELAEQAAEWQQAVDEAASGDEDMAEYVHSLEEREGEPQPRPPSGEELAKAFEKYLRRPGDNT